MLRQRYLKGRHRLIYSFIIARIFYSTINRNKDTNIRTRSCEKRSLLVNSSRNDVFICLLDYNTSLVIRFDWFESSKKLKYMRQIQEVKGYTELAFAYQDILRLSL